jgi:hypothetical protein
LTYKFWSALPEIFEEDPSFRPDWLIWSPPHTRVIDEFPNAGSSQTPDQTTEDEMIPIEETMPADTHKRGALPSFRTPASNEETIQLDDYRHHHPLFLTDLEGEASLR